jgi:hypothetical protein
MCGLRTVNRTVYPPISKGRSEIQNCGSLTGHFLLLNAKVHLCQGAKVGSFICKRYSLSPTEVVTQEGIRSYGRFLEEGRM